MGDLSRTILDSEQISLIISRFCHQIIETYPDMESACLIGIQPRGIYLSRRIIKTLQDDLHCNIQNGTLDITFYRDDFRQRSKKIVASETDIDFPVENKHVLLVDDVLYSGRTIQAAMSALLDFGRPASVKLMSLVDRRFNRHLPIKPDFTGTTVDALDEAYVKVEWQEVHGIDQVLIFPGKVNT